jgi:hypothetical protein
MAIDESQDRSAFSELIEWARQIVRVRFEGKAPAAPETNLQQKDGPTVDPNGRK